MHVRSGMYLTEQDNHGKSDVPAMCIMLSPDLNLPARACNDPAVLSLPLCPPPLQVRLSARELSAYWPDQRQHHEQRYRRRHRCQHQQRGVLPASPAPPSQPPPHTSTPAAPIQQVHPPLPREKATPATARSPRFDSQPQVDAAHTAAHQPSATAAAPTVSPRPPDPRRRGFCTAGTNRRPPCSGRRWPDGRR